MGFGLGLMVVGTLMGASGERKAGRRAAQRGREQKAFDEVYAGQVIAIGQRAALEQTRQAKLMASRAIAVAAAGGASQDIDHLIADIEGEGVYRASLAMYEAETEAERIKFQGLMAERTGRDLQSASNKRALATLISGAGSLYAGSRNA